MNYFANMSFIFQRYYFLHPLCILFAIPSDLFFFEREDEHALTDTRWFILAADPGSNHVAFRRPPSYHRPSLPIFFISTRRRGYGYALVPRRLSTSSSFDSRKNLLALLSFHPVNSPRILCCDYTEKRRINTPEKYLNSLSLSFSLSLKVKKRENRSSLRSRRSEISWLAFEQSEAGRVYR